MQPRFSPDGTETPYGARTRPLSELQDLVGGFVRVIRIDDARDLVCHDGAGQDAERNGVATDLYGEVCDLGPGESLSGTVLVLGDPAEPSFSDPESERIPPESTSPD